MKNYAVIICFLFLASNAQAIDGPGGENTFCVWRSSVCLNADDDVHWEQSSEKKRSMLFAFTKGRLREIRAVCGNVYSVANVPGMRPSAISGERPGTSWV